MKSWSTLLLVTFVLASACGKKEEAPAPAPAAEAEKAAGEAAKPAGAEAAKPAEAPVPPAAPVDHLAAAKAKLKPTSADDVLTAFIESMAALEAANSNPANPAQLAAGQEVGDVAGTAVTNAVWPNPVVASDADKARVKDAATAGLLRFVSGKAHVRAFLAGHAGACGNLLSTDAGKAKVDELIQQGSVGEGASEALWQCRFQSGPRDAAARAGKQFNRADQLADEARVWKGVVPPAVQAKLMAQWTTPDVKGATAIGDAVIAAWDSFNPGQQDIAVMVLGQVCTKAHVQQALDKLKAATDPMSDSMKKALTEKLGTCK